MNKIKFKNLKFQKNRGITIFIAVVITSILLFISFAVANITLKSMLFSSSGKDSQHAFYAADAGLECAIYWDSKFSPSKFATSTSGGSIICADNSITDNQSIPGITDPTLIGGGGSSNPTSIFYFVLNTGSEPTPYCAIVRVTKNDDGTTYVESRGYNTCDTSNPRRVERGIEATY